MAQKQMLWLPLVDVVLIHECGHILIAGRAVLCMEGPELLHTWGMPDTVVIAIGLEEDIVTRAVTLHLATWVRHSNMREDQG